MRVSIPNLAYALAHPLKACRYVRHRDQIDYASIARFIPKEPVILEAGVANGVNTEEMALFWDQAIIHGFEPVPSARALAIEKTATLRERVFIHDYALGDQAGSFTMNVSGEGDPSQTQSSSLLKPTGHLKEYDFVPFDKTVEVEVVRLDDWAAEQGVKRLDFLWLDLQGYELKALQGAVGLLPTVSAIHIEVSHTNLFEGGVLYPELREWLRGHGFRPKIEATFRLGGNVLFAR